jgi:hypothetical protein
MKVRPSHVLLVNLYHPGGSFPALTRPGALTPILTRQAGSSQGVSSAPGRIRTCGPLLRRQPLCPLSYGGSG